MSALPYYQLSRPKSTIANYFRNFFGISWLIIVRFFQILFFLTVKMLVFLLVYIAIECAFTGRDFFKLFTK